MPRIFTPNDQYQMALANAAIGWLPFQGFGPLTNIIERIKSIDDPYYMRELTPATYGSLVAMGKERGIAA
jgi:hypothetical protein